MLSAQLEKCFLKLNCAKVILPNYKIQGVGSTFKETWIEHLPIDIDFAITGVAPGQKGLLRPLKEIEIYDVTPYSDDGHSLCKAFPFINLLFEHLSFALCEVNEYFDFQFNPVWFFSPLGLEGIIFRFAHTELHLEVMVYIMITSEPTTFSVQHRDSFNSFVENLRFTEGEKSEEEFLQQIRKLKRESYIAATVNGELDPMKKISGHLIESFLTAPEMLPRRFSTLVRYVKERDHDFQGLSPYELLPYPPWPLVGAPIDEIISTGMCDTEYETLLEICDNA